MAIFLQLPRPVSVAKECLVLTERQRLTAEAGWPEGWA